MFIILPFNKDSQKIIFAPSINFLRFIFPLVAARGSVAPPLAFYCRLLAIFAFEVSTIFFWTTNRMETLHEVGQYLEHAFLARANFHWEGKKIEGKFSWKQGSSIVGSNANLDGTGLG